MDIERRVGSEPCFFAPIRGSDAQFLIAVPRGCEYESLTVRGPAWPFLVRQLAFRGDTWCLDSCRRCHRIDVNVSLVGGLPCRRQIAAAGCPVRILRRTRGPYSRSVAVPPSRRGPQPQRYRLPSMPGEYQPVSVGDQTGRCLSNHPGSRKSQADPCAYREPTGQAPQQRHTEQSEFVHRAIERFPDRVT